MGNENTKKIVLKLLKVAMILIIIFVLHFLWGLAGYPPLNIELVPETTENEYP